MTSFFTEGIVQMIEFEKPEKTRIKIDPTPPYKFTEKVVGTDRIRILFVSDYSNKAQTVAVFSQTKKGPGVFVDFGDVKSEEILKALSISCGTERSRRVFRLRHPSEKVPECQTAVLLDSDVAFRIADDISAQINFGALLALKQNRTKVRFEVKFDELTKNRPEEIVNVTVCE